ncbi:prephenate dehydratase [Desertihabitans aurantiacus]|uniref:prephenate dehydratase n=1 Tax=Desertihabitans aurantiacus TaxID=2282477 RepID=UPI000DF7590C|nr:prephenate dehydratase [Desertihabitans aurantiacus]
MTSATHGYLGPAGTFTHQALLTLGDLPGEAVPYPSVPAALHAVRSGEVSAVLVPIENSVEGGVSATLDALTHGDPLQITREVVIPVQFDLYVRPGTELSQVRSVVSHPHAIAQCREWLDAHLPDAVVTEGGSTAAAAVVVADPASGFDAAICAPVAGAAQGLVAAATSIADNASAETRFVLVARPGPLPPRTGADKTTLVAFLRIDRSGALLEILEQFAGRGVNLCRIESRPTRTTLGHYCFSIDAEGHLDDARLAEAVMGLHRVCSEVVFLGSYPRADGASPTVAEGQSDADYTEAAAWLAGLRRPDRS